MQVNKKLLIHRNIFTHERIIIIHQHWWEIGIRIEIEPENCHWHMNDRANERANKRASSIATVCLYVLMSVIVIVVAVVVAVAYNRKTLIQHIGLSLSVVCLAYATSEHDSWTVACCFCCCLCCCHCRCRYCCCCFVWASGSPNSKAKSMNRL